MRGRLWLVRETRRRGRAGGTHLSSAILSRRPRRTPSGSAPIEQLRLLLAPRRLLSGLFVLVATFATKADAMKPAASEEPGAEIGGRRACGDGVRLRGSAAASSEHVGSVRCDADF